MGNPHQHPQGQPPEAQLGGRDETVTYLACGDLSSSSLWRRVVMIRRTGLYHDEFRGERRGGAGGNVVGGAADIEPFR